MGIACHQIRLLTLTSRKSTCEYQMTIDEMEKLAITREMNELQRTFSQKLSSKNIAYYDNGKYNKVNYQYLMGYGCNFMPVLNESKPLKECNDMVLSDYNGRVVLSDAYANAIKAVCGDSIMDAKGVGGTFSQENIADIMAYLLPGYDADTIRNGFDEMGYTTHNENTITRESTGTGTGDSSEVANEELNKLINFYFPIFQAAAANGWTTQYNTEMANNSNYVSDSIVSGNFQLVMVNSYGQYTPDTSLQYFITSGMLDQTTFADEREEIQAEFDRERAIVEEKENLINLEIQSLSTEVEAIKAEIESEKKFLQDGMEQGFRAQS